MKLSSTSAEFYIACGDTNNPGGGKVDSALYSSEFGEMSSSVVNAAQVYPACADRQRPPSHGELLSSSAHSWGWYVPQSTAIMHNANDSLHFCNVKLCVSVKFQPYVKK